MQLPFRNGPGVAAALLACLMAGCAPAPAYREGGGKTMTANSCPYVILAPGASVAFGTSPATTNGGTTYYSENPVPANQTATVVTPAITSSYLGPTLIETEDNHVVSVMPGSTVVLNTDQSITITSGGISVSNASHIPKGQGSSGNPITVKSGHTTTGVFGSSFAIQYTPASVKTPADSETISLFNCEAGTTVTATSFSPFPSSAPYDNSTYQYGVQLVMSPTDGSSGADRAAYSATGAPGLSSHIGPAN